MKNYLAHRVIPKVKVKGLFEIYALALEKEREGNRVIHMEIGRPDFDTPEKIKKSAIAALEEGQVYYTEPMGTLELRSAITNYVKKNLGLDYDPKTQVLVTVGASEALDLIWRAFLEPDEEVMIPSPYYGAYTFQLEYSDKRYTTIPILNDQGEVKYDIDAFKAKLTPKTKMILINSPNNPTGYVMSDEEIQAIADFAIENDLLVISDECYDRYVFEGEFKSIASLPGMKERTIIVNSTSKTFSMTGWRVGYVIAQPEFIQAMMRIHAQTIVCPSSFAQAGAATAYGEDIEEVEEMMDQFKRRKEYIGNFLKTLKGIPYVDPKGAFYVFMNISSLGMEGAEFCERLIEEQGVTLSPGNNFGMEWKDYVRISYACSMEDIKEAMDKIKIFVEKYQK